MLPDAEREGINHPKRARRFPMARTARRLRWTSAACYHVLNRGYARVEMGNC